MSPEGAGLSFVLTTMKEMRRWPNLFPRVNERELPVIRQRSLGNQQRRRNLAVLWWMVVKKKWRLKEEWNGILSQGILSIMLDTLCTRIGKQSFSTQMTLCLCHQSGSVSETVKKIALHVYMG
jgi:hypothetical protein